MYFVNIIYIYPPGLCGYTHTYMYIYLPLENSGNRGNRLFFMHYIAHKTTLQRGFTGYPQKQANVVPAKSRRPRVGTAPPTDRFLPETPISDTPAVFYGPRHSRRHTNAKTTTFLVGILLTTNNQTQCRKHPAAHHPRSPTPFSRSNNPPSALVAYSFTTAPSVRSTTPTFAQTLTHHRALLDTRTTTYENYTTYTTATPRHLRGTSYPTKGNTTLREAGTNDRSRG